MCTIDRCGNNRKVVLLQRKPTRRRFTVLHEISSLNEYSFLRCPYETLTARFPVSTDVAMLHESGYTTCLHESDVPVRSLIAHLPRISYLIHRTMGSSSPHNGWLLSAFTAEHLPKDKQFPSGTYQGTKYFSYNGKTMLELRKEKGNW